MAWLLHGECFEKWENTSKGDYIWYIIIIQTSTWSVCQRWSIVFHIQKTENRLLWVVCCAVSFKGQCYEGSFDFKSHEHFKFYCDPSSIFSTIITFIPRHYVSIVGKLGAVATCAFQCTYVWNESSKHSSMHPRVGSGERLKNTHELLNLRALKFSPVNKIYIFQSISKIFCV